MAVAAIFAPVSTAAIAASTLTDSGRLLTASPKEVAYKAGAGTVTIDIDLGAIMPVSAIYLGGMSSALNFTVTGGTVGYTTTAIGVSTTAHKLSGLAPRKTMMTFTELNVRYIRLDGPAAPDGFQIGNLVIGKAFRPTYGHEWGAGRTIGDTGSATQLLSGDFGILDGARFRQWDFTLGDLTDDEVEALDDFLMTVGNTRQVVVCEDTAQTNYLDARTHYGLFDKIDKFERLIPGATKWSLKVKEWV